ncbi:MAG: MATE family efflux transporter, partial [Clostridia bacterium]|nr:MATE family efflux transporter [Clostridia bacterium]
AGAVVSTLLGARRQKDADVTASSSFFASLLVGTLITVLGICFLTPLMQLFGAAQEAEGTTTLQYASTYSFYILLSAPFMCASFVMNNLLRSQGKAWLSMIGLVTGAVLNVALDPILIYGFSMGIDGAAVATMVSQIVSFVILLMMFLSGKSIARLRLKCVSLSWRVYGEVIATGFPSFCRQMLASLCTLLLNHAVISYEGGQGAVGVVQKVFMLAFSISLGIGQGYQPALGYNYAAKRYDRVKKAYLFTLFFAMGLMTVFAIVCAIVAPLIMNAFLDSAIAREIGKTTLRLQCIGMPLLPVNFMAAVTYQVVGNKVSASALSVSRQGLFYIPFILLFPMWFGVFGIESAQLFSDIGACLFAIPFTIVFFRKINRLIAAEAKKSEK